MTMRGFRLVVSVIAAVVVVGGMSSVTAGADGGNRHGWLHSTVTSSALELSGVDFASGTCVHMELTTDRCAIPFYESDTFSGDLVGHQQNAGGLSVTIPAFVGNAESIATYTGTVVGCPGPGTATLRYDFKIGVTPGHNEGTVEVVRDSGTGGLVTLEGHGEVVTDTTSGSAVSTARLLLSCNNRHHHD